MWEAMLRAVTDDWGLASGRLGRAGWRMNHVQAFVCFLIGLALLTGGIASVLQMFAGNG